MRAYLVLDLAVRDWPGFLQYVSSIPALIGKHGGRYVVHGAEPTVIEGDWAPERVVIIEFRSRPSAEAFLSDPEAQALFKVRHETTTSKLILVDEFREGQPQT